MSVCMRNIVRRLISPLLWGLRYDVLWCCPFHVTFGRPRVLDAAINLLLWKHGSEKLVGLRNTHEGEDIALGRWMAGFGEAQFYFMV